jgi:DNA-directed RNA polymerase specialized sigma24 family protein
MKDEVLTPEDFDRLLRWLDSNPEQAALKYERTRIRLITFFVGGNCGCEADRLADEAFDRVSIKLKAGQVSEDHNRDKVFYFLGFAKNIRYEYLRELKPDELTGPVIDPNETKDNVDTEDELECLDQCIGELPKEKRWLVIEYYRFEGSAKIEHRKKIASQLRIDAKALRLRVHRIREQLKPCVEACLMRNGVSSSLGGTS